LSCAQKKKIKEDYLINFLFYLIIYFGFFFFFLFLQGRGGRGRGRRDLALTWVGRYFEMWW
jgi:hypothetical protein